MFLMGRVMTSTLGKPLFHLVLELTNIPGSIRIRRFTNIGRSVNSVKDHWTFLYLSSRTIENGGNTHSQRGNICGTQG